MTQHEPATQTDVEAYEFAEGEEMRTEVSTKFRREGIERELEAAGLELRHFWSDEGGDFGLFLAFR